MCAISPTQQQVHIRSRPATRPSDMLSLWSGSWSEGAEGHFGASDIYAANRVSCFKEKASGSKHHATEFASSLARCLNLDPENRAKMRQRKSEADHDESMTGTKQKEVQFHTCTLDARNPTLNMHIRTPDRKQFLFYTKEPILGRTASTASR